jgi:tetratricopeptide (TPR) repeat protein
MEGLTSEVQRIDEGSIREALEKMRQARSLQGCALMSSLWMQVGAPLGEGVGIEVTIMDKLVGLITERLTTARHALGLSTDGLTPEEAFQQDYTEDNIPLEAWSTLYYRYVRTELAWSVAQLAELAYTNTRTIRRRVDVGLRRVAEAVNRYEIETRQAHWGAWLRSKMPPKPYSQLRGFDGLQGDLREALLTLGDAPFVQISGGAGVGKTALTHAVLSRLVTENAVGDFAWLTARPGMVYEGLLAAFARALGYAHLVKLPAADLATALRTICARQFTVLIVDRAELLGNSYGSLNRLEPLLGGGRLLVVSRSPRQMMVPTVDFHMEPPTFEVFMPIMLDHIRLKRMPLRGVDKKALCQRLYTLTGGNLTMGKRLLSEAERLDEADFESTLVRVKGEQESPRAIFTDDATQIEVLGPFVREKGLWGEWRIFLEEMLAGEDLPAEQRALAHHEMGVTLLWFGEMGDAVDHLQQASTLAVGALRGEVQLSLARVYFRQAEVDAAQQAYERAVVLAQKGGHEELVQQALRGLTNIALHIHDTNLLYSVLQRLDENVLGADYYAIHGAVAMAMNEAQQAIAHYKAALALHELDTHAQAVLRFRLGVAYFKVGRRAEAIEVFEGMLLTMRALGDVFAEARALANLGAAYADGEEYDAAVQAWRKAATLQESLADVTARAYTLYNLADVAWKQNAPEAGALFELAWELAETHAIEALKAHLRVHPALTDDD